MLIRDEEAALAKRDLTWRDVLVFLRSPAVLGAIAGAVVTAISFTVFLAVWWLCRRIRRRRKRRTADRVAAALDMAEHESQPAEVRTPSFFSPGSWKPGAYQYNAVPTTALPPTAVQHVQLPPAVTPALMTDTEHSSEDEEKSGAWSATSSPSKTCSTSGAPRALSLRTVRPVTASRALPTPALPRTLWPESGRVPIPRVALNASPALDGSGGPLMRSKTASSNTITQDALHAPSPRLVRSKTTDFDTVLHGSGGGGGHSQLSSLASRDTACSAYSAQSGEARRQSSTAAYFQRLRRVRETRAERGESEDAMAKTGDRRASRDGCFEYVGNGIRRPVGEFGT